MIPDLDGVVRHQLDVVVEVSENGECFSSRRCPRSLLMAAWRALPADDRRRTQSQFRARAANGHGRFERVSMVGRPVLN